MIRLEKAGHGIVNPISNCVMYHNYQNRKGAKCSQRIMQCDQCSKQMNSPVYIWKYEAQHHWATVHSCRVLHQDIGSDSCPIPEAFKISDGEWAAMTKCAPRRELLGF